MCFCPVQCALCWDLHTGSKKLVFTPNIDEKRYQFIESLRVPCGQCSECRLEKSRQWAIRLVHEASQYKDSCFLTLTYDNKHLPSDKSINKDDVTKFMKRLRQYIHRELGLEDKKIKYFYCGEYGEKMGRPHYHMILYGFKFPDQEIAFTTRDKSQTFILYKSKRLNEIWGKGMCNIGAVSFETCAYVARYVLKKVTGDKAEEHYQGKLPEFICMSRRPGIGYAFFDKFKDDIYKVDKVFTRKTRTGQLKVLRPPRYYDYLFDKVDFDKCQEIKKKRKEKFDNIAVMLNNPRVVQNLEENCKRHRIGRLLRKFESISDSDFEKFQSNED